MPIKTARGAHYKPHLVARRPDRPSPRQVIDVRERLQEKFGLTKRQAITYLRDLIYVGERYWHDLEAGRIALSPNNWELLNLKLTMMYHQSDSEARDGV